ncbi:MAG: hypothetical protein ACLVBC_17660 [Parabacteroides distasonis]
MARSVRGIHDINRNAPEGSWSSNGMDAFYPRHELRARNQSNLMNSDKKYNDAYYLQQFRQFEQTRNFSRCYRSRSDYMNEEVGRWLPAFPEELE